MRKEKWKYVTVTSSNVDDYLNDLYHDTKAQHINQGVSFNKDDPYQMGLLRLALIEPQAFSGLCKKLLNLYFESKNMPIQNISFKFEILPQEKIETKSKEESRYENMWIDFT